MSAIQTEFVTLRVDAYVHVYNAKKCNACSVTYDPYRNAFDGLAELMADAQGRKSGVRA